MTGQYLNDLTSHITIEKIFSRIDYFNRTHRIFLNVSELKLANALTYSSPELLIRSFYFFKLKCIEIHLNISFREEELFFLKTKNVLNINFNRTFFKESKRLYFIYKIDRARQIGGGFTYEIQRTNKSDQKFIAYEMEFQFFEVKRNDRFEDVKNLKSFFYPKVRIKEEATYIWTMKENFQRNYGLTTRSYFLENDTFHMEIDDLLFDQYYLQVQKKNDDRAVSMNYVKDSCTTFTQTHVESKPNKPDFLFSFASISKQLEITNEENYQKLIINILNSFSLWLNYSMPNLRFVYIFVFIQKVSQFFLPIHSFLFNAEIHLRLKIKQNLRIGMIRF